MWSIDLRNAVGDDVQLSIVLADDLGMVQVDRGYFENALINLAINARDAVRRKGEVLKERLEEINSPHVLDVRGRGLLLGLQLDIPAGDVVKAGFAHGLVLVNAGPDVLRLAPPLVITDAELDTVVERLDAILKTW